MTPSSRLRLLFSRLLGERRMLAVARWVAGPRECRVEGIQWHIEWLTQRRKRRALARRRLARRAKRRVVFPQVQYTERVSECGTQVFTGELVYAHGGKWWPSNRPTVCDVPGQYGPSGAADLGYVNKSQSTNKETA